VSWDKLKFILQACGPFLASFRNLKMKLCSQDEGTESSAPPYCSSEKRTSPLSLGRAELG